MIGTEQERVIQYWILATYTMGSDTMERIETVMETLSEMELSSEGWINFL